MGDKVFVDRKFTPKWVFLVRQLNKKNEVDLYYRESKNEGLYSSFSIALRNWSISVTPIRPTLVASR